MPCLYKVLALACLCNFKNLYRQSSLTLKIDVNKIPNGILALDYDIRLQLTIFNRDSISFSFYNYYYCSELCLFFKFT